MYVGCAHHRAQAPHATFDPQLACMQQLGKRTMIFAIFAIVAIVVNLMTS